MDGVTTWPDREVRLNKFPPSFQNGSESYNCVMSVSVLFEHLKGEFFLHNVRNNNFNFIAKFPLEIFLKWI